MFRFYLFVMFTVMVKIWTEVKKYSKWKGTKNTVSGMYSLHMINTCIALKAWELTGFVGFFLHWSFFLPFPVLTSPNIANMPLFSNLLHVFHNASLLRNLQMMMMKKKKVYCVPSTVLVSWHTSPPHLRTRWVVFHFIDEENGA